MSRAARRERGFALLVVLWSVTLLALIATRLTASGRTEIQIAGNLRANAAAEAAADGGVQEAIFRLLSQGAERWSATGLGFVSTIGTARVEVRAEAVLGRINPNTAPAALLAALLRQFGVEPRLAAGIGDAIEAWRTPAPPATLAVRAAPYRAAGRAALPPGAAFESIDELAAVLGMTPPLLGAIRPSLSVYNFAAVDAARAAPAVVRALAESGTQQAEGDDVGLIMEVTALARPAGGGSFTRHAVVRLRPAAGERPYQILAWEAGGS
jgi:general secretion pathway protein K